MIKGVTKVANGIWIYIKDWRNLLTHTLIGVILVALALFVPVKPIYRILGLCLVILFNIIRMQLKKTRQKPIVERDEDDAAK